MCINIDNTIMANAMNPSLAITVEIVPAQICTCNSIGRSENWDKFHKL